MTDSITRHLGKTSAYVKQYDPDLLVRESRQSNRTYLGIDGANLPFVGFDVWNAYEVSALNHNGLPYSFVVRLSYDCTNPWIVESKSLKLYFNSFAMTRLGHAGDDVKDVLRNMAITDLSYLLETPVSVSIWHQKELFDIDTPDLRDEYHMDHFKTLEHMPGADSIIFTDYAENPALLDRVDDKLEEWSDFHSSSLVSCCKVTSQPDSGDIFISMKGQKKPSPQALLKYIVSFRDENHFHEEICEAVFKRLYDTYNPSALLVCCLYSRRGGIDINPYRYFGEHIDDEGFKMLRDGIPVKLPRQ